MRRLLLFLISTLLSQAGFAQVVAGEYFFDVAPAQGAGFSFTLAPGNNVNGTFSVPVSSLSPGFHNLFMRVKNAAGVWSHFEGRLFYILPNSVGSTTAQIIAAEYFFDADPGQGNATGINITPGNSVSQAVSISTGSLSPGFHQLGMRVKNASGSWSHFESRMFYILPNNLPTINTQITAAEWFLDTDPGVGNAASLAVNQGTNIIQSVNIPLSSLSPGSHQLFIRVKDNRGSWSHYEGRSFYVCASPIATPIVSGNTSYCTGSLIQLNASAVAGAQAYQWSGPNGFSSTGLNLSIPNADSTNAGTYTLVATGSGNTICDTGRVEVPVTVFPALLPLVNANANQLSTGSFSSYQWRLNGADIPGATSQTYTATQPGNYSVSVTDVNGCNETSPEYVLLITADEAGKQLASIKVLPNPSAGNFILSAELENFAGAMVSITDMQGRLIYSAKADAAGKSMKQEINLGDVSKGIYLLSLQTIQSTFVTKILVEK